MAAAKQRLSSYWQITTPHHRRWILKIYVAEASGDGTPPDITDPGGDIDELTASTSDIDDGTPFVIDDTSPEGFIMSMVI